MGVWWVVFTVPVMLFVKESAAAALPFGAAIGAGVRELVGTIRHLRGDRTLLWFLLAYWFYIDGVNTIIKMAVDYGLSLGLEQDSLIKALLSCSSSASRRRSRSGGSASASAPRTGMFIGIARVHRRGGATRTSWIPRSSSMRWPW